MVEGLFIPFRRVPPPPTQPPVAQKPDPCIQVLCVAITEIVCLVLGIVNIKDGIKENDGLKITLGSVFLAASSCIFICVTAIAIKSCLDRKRAAAPAVSSDYTALNA